MHGTTNLKYLGFPVHYFKTRKFKLKFSKIELFQSSGEKVGEGVLLKWALSLPQPLDHGLRIAVSYFQHSAKEKNP
jgi:hypothetical protein